MYFYEYQEIPLSKENHNLLEHIKKSLPLHKYFKEEWGKIKTTQYCGVINYEEEDYYILPKIANHNSENLDIFIYMLRYVYDIKIDNEDIASSKNIKSNNLLEIFIQMFAKNLFKEFQKGIYKEYITKQDNLTTLKGKYLINENLKYNFTNSKIYCEYDEFSEDNSLNQLFLYAVKQLQKYVKNKKLLKQCELVLNEVQLKQIDINRVDIHFNRLNQRFKNSFEFAMLLLNRSIPLFKKDKKSFAFLFDMNVLFEKFIGKIYKEIDNNTKLQYKKDFGNLKLIPDIYTANLIIDVKYKLANNKKDLKRDDKYQMFVYGTNFGVKNTMLLYPKHNMEENLNRTKPLLLGEKDNIISLKMKSIDLNFYGDYKEFLNEIKNRIKRICYE